MGKPKKQKNGKYQYRIRIKHPITGEWKEKSTTLPTIKACREWEVEVRKSILDGINPDKIPLLPFFDLWYETYKKNSVGRDHRNKIMATRKSIVEFFGEEQTLKGIDKMKYQQWINYLGIEKKQAKATVSDKHKIFKAVLMEALDAGHIHRNPCRNINLVGRDTSNERKKSLTQEEWIKLKDTILASKEESASKYVALTMMYLGLRFQEADGLRYSDIDLKNRTVSITQAFDYKDSKELGKTKTPGSVRTVDMPDALVDILNQYIKKKKSENNVIALRSNKDEFLFTNELGVPITNAAINKFLKAKCKKAGIEKITSHAFRHAKVDLLVLADSDMIYTQKQMGHVDPSTTLKYYSELNKDIREKNFKNQNDFMNAKNM